MASWPRPQLCPLLQAPPTHPQPFLPNTHTHTPTFFFLFFFTGFYLFSLSYPFLVYSNEWVSEWRKCFETLRTAKELMGRLVVAKVLWLLFLSRFPLWLWEGSFVPAYVLVRCLWYREKKRDELLLFRCCYVGVGGGEEKGWVVPLLLCGGGGGGRLV